MNSILNYAAMKSWRGTIAFLAGLVMLAAAPSAWAAAAAAQKTFASPEEAVKELVAAMRADDAKALLVVLGTGAKDIVSSGDAVADRTTRERFVQAYEQANKIEGAGDGRAIVSIGKDGWPFPIPVVKVKDGWRFDVKQGREEILNRRIGRNELTVIQVVKAYVDAQRDYYLLNPQQDKLLSYAQKFVSTKGKRDGLYYPTKNGEQPSPLGSLFAAARAEGYKAGTASHPNAYHGYYYKILKAQGKDAPGGAYGYVAQGKMIGGHALVAWPATYGNSGVMSFIVNHDGAVYQKDLGPGSAEAAQKMTTFNPDGTWTKQ